MQICLLTHLQLEGTLKLSIPLSLTCHHSCVLCAVTYTLDVWPCQFSPAPSLRFAIKVPGQVQQGTTDPLAEKRTIYFLMLLQKQECLY